MTVGTLYADDWDDEFPFGLFEEDLEEYEEDVDPDLYDQYEYILDHADETP